MSVLPASHMTQSIRSGGTCRHPQRSVARTLSTSRCLQAYNAKCAQCSGIGGRPTVASLLAIMAATRIFFSQTAIGSDRRLLGGPLGQAPALDLLVPMDIS